MGGDVAYTGTVFAIKQMIYLIKSGIVYIFAHKSRRQTETA